MSRSPLRPFANGLLFSDLTPNWSDRRSRCRRASGIARADGMTDSQAVRTALGEAAARCRIRSSIRDEVQRLVADEPTQQMRVVREQRAEVAFPLTD